jgi:formylglycine-generating enzyme required for sulfatase activity/serine/threonine protein kinase
MAKDFDKSLGDQNTFQGQAKPKPQEVDTRSIGDQATFAGEIIGDVVDDSVEVVDIAARYEIEKTLGKGGMGEVLLATDKRLDRQVAIKRIRGDSSRSKTAVNRFLTEAKAIASLSHPNIVHINDYGRDKEGPFLIMEYVDGGSLLDRCRDGALPIDQAIELTSQLCDGLAKAHDRGIIHRDIKPANILLTKDGVPKLSDFGLAKAESTDTGMTVAGAVLGTLDFMPPEQRRDAALADARSDLWSLAATLYQMVTGESPRVIDLDLCPPELRAFLAQGLKSKKEDRYQSAREFRDALNRAADSTQPTRLDQLITGECPQCHAKNESTRKFCRGCAEPLEVLCLRCNAKMPIWENICGECGTKQLELLQPRREALQANRDSALACLELLDFDNAKKFASNIQDETDPRLQHLRAWCNGFLIEIDNRRAQELQHVQQLLAEATSHERAHDYTAAIRTLEQVPESLRSISIDDNGITATAMLSRIESIEKRRQRLEIQIREQIAKREMDGLSDLVLDLLEISPNRNDLLRLKSQLEERTAKLIAIRDEAFAEAQSKRKSQDYEGALGELAKIDPSVMEPSMVTEKNELVQTIRELNQLLRSIQIAIEAKNYTGLSDQVNRFLELKCDHAEMQQLRAQLLERDAQNLQKIKQLISNAEDYKRSIRFEDALKLLLTIPMEYRTEATNALTDSCSRLETERKRAFENLRTGIKRGRYDEGLEGVQAYQSLLHSHSLADTELNRLLPEFQKEIERSEANRAIAKQVLIALVAIGTPAIFIGSIVSINNHNRWVEEQMRIAAIKAEKEEKEASDRKKVEERIAAEKAESEAKERKREQERIANEKAIAAKAKAEVDRIAAEAEAKAEADRIAAAEAKAEADRIVAAKAKAEADRIVAEAQAKAEADRIAVEAQAKEAKAIFAERPFINSINLALKKLPAGKFVMGEGSDAHEVSLTKPFYIGVYEVTQEQYQRVMGTNPSFFEGASNPVEDVSWEDAVRFCRKLSELPEEKNAGRVYRLPTEAEWEYACRGGTTTEFSFGDDRSKLGEYAWVDKNSGRATHPVGKKKPNAWGLYDMHGNVWEWCSDWYGDYPKGAVTDPVGPVNGSLRVRRGGSWFLDAAICVSALRNGGTPVYRLDTIGFRLALSSPGIPK